MKQGHKIGSSVVTTPGQLLVNEALPEDLRDYGRVMSADESTEVLKDLIRKHPQEYRRVSHDLMDLGRDAAFESGVTIRLRDLQSPIDREKVFEEVNEAVRDIKASGLSERDKAAAIERVYLTAYRGVEKDTYDKALADSNPIALQVLSKARGNKRQLAALLSTPGVYQDGAGRTIPFFIRHSYSEGLSPAEYWASTYGARAGVVSTKFAVAEAGALGKQFSEAAAGLRVTGEDCGGVYGVPMSISDTDNVGALLARPSAGLGKDTIIDHSVLSRIEDEGEDEIIVRSPMTCAQEDGVCQRCAGVRETGELPGIGSFIGNDASSALAERVAQSALGVKHGGTLGEGGEPTLSGFELIDKLTQVPKHFPMAATLSSVSGQVESVEDAPQGGKYVTVEGNRFFVGPHSRVIVEEGQSVELGDQLSSGIVNPREIVEYKGIGEGRRHFANSLTEAFRGGGYDVNRRNVEVLARAVIDNTVVQDQDKAGGHLPGDVVSYNAMAHTYRPRKDAYNAAPGAAVGKYLEQPALHYTIGTRLSKGMADRLRKHGLDSVHVNEKPPGFEPHMLSLRDIPRHGEDWMAQLGSSYLKSTFLGNVHRAAGSSLIDPQPGPAVARGVGLAEEVKIEDS